MSIKVITNPAVEPVSLQEIKDHLRLGDDSCTDDDDLLQSYIKAARQLLEKCTYRAFIEQTFEMKMDQFPSRRIVNYAHRSRASKRSQTIYLPNPPLISVTSIKYIDEDEVEQTLSSSLYSVDIPSEPARIYPIEAEQWPDVQNFNSTVTVEYKAGYGTVASSVPEPIRLAIKLLVGEWFENREAVVVGTNAVILPFGVDALIGPYRVIDYNDQEQFDY